MGNCFAPEEAHEVRMKRLVVQIAMATYERRDDDAKELVAQLEKEQAECGNRAEEEF